MLKRNIAVLIAGGLLGAQATLAAADQGTFPSNDTGVYSKALPAQVEYFKQREASIQKEAARPRGSVFPTTMGGSPSAGTGVAAGYRSPALNKYLDERAASIRREQGPAGPVGPAGVIAQSRDARFTWPTDATRPPM